MDVTTRVWSQYARYWPVRGDTLAHMRRTGSLHFLTVGYLADDSCVQREGVEKSKSAYFLTDDAAGGIWFHKGL